MRPTHERPGSRQEAAGAFSGSPHRRGLLLMDWIRQAEQDAPAPVCGFTGFLRQDPDAVTAGLTLEWSSGVVEGNVNRVKRLKRAMYGRASFELLRTRILIQP
ncbi:transposase [Streptomyces sp. NPDC002088]|uniref:transposase n=1 Tax=Streptomyces sp. NPDC002088 TaxID=3154665 RepID=UPI0033340807